MMQLVFLLEERSAKALLDEILPRMLPAGVSYLCIPHEGKQDLEKSIPRKLLGWNQPHTHFVVVRDKDQSDCYAVKKYLKSLCVKGGQPGTLVRIAVHELESWFLGDLQAVASAFGDESLSRRQSKAKFRDPDSLANAAEELRNLVPGYQKLKGARAIAPHMDVNGNQSLSFQHLVSGITRYVEECSG